MVLVTGANGFLGSYLTRLLVKENNRVRILIRKNSCLDLLQDVLDQVEIAYGDILDIPSLEAAFEGVEEVYHTAAIISFESGNKETLLKTNIEGTANIVNFCLSYSVRKLIHTSSVAALGIEPFGGVITEKTKWTKLGSTAYGQSKYYAELEVYRGIAEGLNACIVNPAMIFGGGYWDSGLGSLVDEVYQGYGFYTPGSNGVVDVRDVAQAMLKLMKSPISGEQFILISDNASFKSVMTDLAGFMKVPPPRFQASPWLVYLVCAWEWLKSKIGQKKALISRETAQYTLKNYTYSSEKIQKALDFHFTPFSKTLEDTAQAYLQAKAAGKNYQVIQF